MGFFDFVGVYALAVALLVLTISPTQLTVWERCLYPNNTLLNKRIFEMKQAKPQARLDRADGDAASFRDLLTRQSLKIRQFDRSPLLFAQALQRLTDERRLL